MKTDKKAKKKGERKNKKNFKISAIKSKGIPLLL